MIVSNDLSGLTEAFYRKLPIVAITSSQAFGRVGQLFPQFTDRNVISNDVAKESVQIPYPYSEEEKWSNNIKINKVLGLLIYFCDYNEIIINGYSATKNTYKSL